MAWKFWKSDANKSDAERSLEQLTSAATTTRPATDLSGSAGTTSDSKGGESGTGFRMVVDDVFAIVGRGTVATGTVSSGTVRTSQMIWFTDTRGRERRVTVIGIEAARQSRSEASAGDTVGILLRGVEKSHMPAGVELRA